MSVRTHKYLNITNVREIYSVSPCFVGLEEEKNISANVRFLNDHIHINSKTTDRASDI